VEKGADVAVFAQFWTSKTDGLFRSHVQSLRWRDFFARRSLRSCRRFLRSFGWPNSAFIQTIQ